MMKSRYVIFLLLFLFFSSALSYSQEVSEKQDISIFNLSYYAWDIPDEVLGSIDSEIRSVFVNLGRFNVLEVRKRFANDSDLQSFIDSIREMKEKTVEIPEEVSYGHVIFTEADFEQLISSFIVIIPEVTYFNVEKVYDDEGEIKEYKVELKTSYSILDASNMTVVAKPSVKSSGEDENRKSAIQDAIEGIPMSLAFEIKSVSIFTLKTGVREVYGRGVTIEKGKNMGILPGFEFEIIQIDELSSGLKRDRHVGLLIVNSVFEEVSEATILYGKPKIGDQLREVPRVGVDASFYYETLINPFGEELTFSHLVGMRGALALGVFSVRPIVGVEIPFIDYGGAKGFILLIGIPVTGYIGAEFNLYLGRLQIVPTLAAGIGGIYVNEDIADEFDLDPPFIMSHFGGKAQLTISYLVSRDAKIVIDTGYAYWVSVAEDIVDSYHGIIGGIGFTIKI